MKKLRNWKTNDEVIVRRSKNSPQFNGCRGVITELFTSPGGVKCAYVILEGVGRAAEFSFERSELHNVTQFFESQRAATVHTY